MRFGLARIAKQSNLCRIRNLILFSQKLPQDLPPDKEDLVLDELLLKTASLAYCLNAMGDQYVAGFRSERIIPSTSDASEKIRQPLMGIAKMARM